MSKFPFMEHDLKLLTGDYTKRCLTFKVEFGIEFPVLT